MGIVNTIRRYFDPSEATIQLQEDSIQRDACGFIGITIIAVAGIAYQFFNTTALAAEIAAGAGAFFLASYFTGKAGYVFVLGLIAASGLFLSTIQAIQDGRFFVHLEIDIAGIIDALRSSSDLV